MRGAAYHGLLVLDKPGGMTSRAAVDHALRWFPRGTRMGHTGTLDPLATGVLVVCLGLATRLTEQVQQMRKTYRTRLLLGARSDTDDADGVVTPQPDVEAPSVDLVRRRLQDLVGEIDQVPPAYSAAHVGGRRAYDLARKGEEVTLQSRRVTVYGIDVLDYVYPRLELEVRCGKGTYIRSLARDLGEQLGCGALVETLRRTRVGPFDAAEALSLEADAATARSRLLPLATAAAELPRVTLPPEELTRLCQGQRVPWSGVEGDGAEVAVFDAAGNLAALALVQRGALKPSKVLPGV